MQAVSNKKKYLAAPDASFDISIHSDSFAAQDYQSLEQLQSHFNTGRITKYPGASLGLLIKQYQKPFLEQAEELLLVHRTAIASYENQSRYAIARLLDRNLVK